METNLITEFDSLITSIERFKDEIIQIQNNNTKLNEDIQALEKEKDLAYQVLILLSSFLRLTNRYAMLTKSVASLATLL